MEHSEKAPSTPREPRGATRRALCIGIGSTAVLMGLGALRFAGSNPLCRPPGGQDEDRLAGRCIRCQRCYEVCPRKVIAPARIEDGVMGMRTPAMSPLDDYCDFCAEENEGEPRCASACPTGALSLDAVELKDRTLVVRDADGNEVSRTALSVPDLGVAVIDERVCLAFRGTGCRLCYDACPLDPKAIELRSGSGSGEGRLVYVVAENCNGCGACESVCISLQAGSAASGATERAVVVRPPGTVA